MLWCSPDISQQSRHPLARAKSRLRCAVACASHLSCWDRFLARLAVNEYSWGAFIRVRQYASLAFDYTQFCYLSIISFLAFSPLQGDWRGCSKSKLFSRYTGRAHRNWNWFYMALPDRLTINPTFPFFQIASEGWNKKYCTCALLNLWYCSHVRKISNIKRYVCKSHTDSLQDFIRSSSQFRALHLNMKCFIINLMLNQKFFYFKLENKTSLKNVIRVIEIHRKFARRGKLAAVVKIETELQGTGWYPLATDDVITEWLVDSPSSAKHELHVGSGFMWQNLQCHGQETFTLNIEQ